MGAQYVTTIFLAQRSIESMAKLNVEDLVWEESDTVVFSYFREVFVRILQLLISCSENSLFCRRVEVLARTIMLMLKAVWTVASFLTFS